MKDGQLIEDAHKIKHLPIVIIRKQLSETI